MYLQHNVAESFINFVVIAVYNNAYIILYILKIHILLTSI